MKRGFCLVVWCLLCFYGLFAQEDGRDRRALLYIGGRVNEISVAPDGRIWLTTLLGNLYCTAHPDSNWHKWNIPEESKKEDDYLGLYNSDLDRITFFNKDTAILSGYIYSDAGKTKKDGYFRTTDGGRHWELRNYGTDCWIYTAFALRDGQAWMGTEGKTIFYSNDYGLNFQKLTVSEMNSGRVYDLFMQDAQHGMLGSNGGEILLTDDNWRTARKIPTPAEQKKLIIKDERHDDFRIQKVLMWRNYLLVKQYGQSFFTSKESIDWQPLPKAVYQFALDEETGNLMAVGENRHLFVFTSPTEYQLFAEDSLPVYFPIDLKVVGGNMYMLMSDASLFFADRDGLRQMIPYTTDFPIEIPSPHAEGKSLVWASERKHLYVAEKSDRWWYREAVLPFRVKDITLLDDSTVVLWDGMENHRYSLRNHVLESYHPFEPLREFLSAPIKEFKIQSGSQGCFHFDRTAMTYTTTPQDSIFEAAYISKDSGWEGSDSVVIDYQVSKHLLINILNEINARPEKIPDIHDFHVTDAEVQQYLAEVDSSLKLGKYHPDKKFPDSAKELFYSIPNRLDEIDTLMLYEILNMDEGFWSTTSNWFVVAFVNQNQDTLFVSSDYYEDPNPWYIPWHFEYKGLHFNCYSLDFSQYIQQCVTEDFFGRTAFGNEGLLMKIGQWYWRKSR